MLLIKRIAASIIDFLLFIAVVISLDWTLKRLDIEATWETISVSSFLITFISPILLSANTIGYNSMKISGYSTNGLKLSLSLKYIILFTIYSNILANTLLLITNLLKDYTYINIPLSFTIRSFIFIFLLNGLIFITSFGTSSLFDLIAGLRYRRKGETKLIGFLSFVYIASASLLISSAIEYKFEFPKILSGSLNYVVENQNKEYLPKELFSKYINTDYVFSKIEKTNRIITSSDFSSLVINKFLPQRIICVLANDKTMSDEKMRLNFCTDLLNYLHINPFPKKQIEQTKIVLIGYKAINPFFSITSTYTYYYDEHGFDLLIYGGFNNDSLIKMYGDIQGFYDSSYSKLSKLILSKNNSISLSGRNASSPDSIKMKAFIKIDSLVRNRLTVFINSRLPTIPWTKFREVKPNKKMLFNLLGPSHAIINNIQYYIRDESLEQVFSIKENYILAN